MLVDVLSTECSEEVKHVFSRLPSH